MSLITPFVYRRASDRIFCFPRTRSYRVVISAGSLPASSTFCCKYATVMISLISVSTMSRHFSLDDSLQYKNVVLYGVFRLISVPSNVFSSVLIVSFHRWQKVAL